MTGPVCSGCGLRSCDGRCYLEDAPDVPEEGDTGKTLEQLITERPELQKYRDELRAELWGLPAELADPLRKVA